MTDPAWLTDWCRPCGLQRARGIRTLIRFGLEHRAVPDDEPDLRTATALAMATAKNPGRPASGQAATTS